MSIKDCLDQAEAGNMISGEERDAIEAIYAKLVKAYGAADAAKVELAARLHKAAEDQSRKQAIAETVRRSLEDYVLAFRDARGQPDPAKALVFLGEHHGPVDMPSGSDSYVARAKSIQGLALSRLEGLLDEFSPRMVTGTTRNTARLANVVREAAGESTGDAAAHAFAKAWLDVAEWLRVQFNEAGGSLGKLEGWFLSQVHDARALLAVGKAQWIARITPRLARDKMRHHLTGAPMTDADLADSLAHIYDTIVTEGRGDGAANAADPFAGVTAVRQGIGAVSNQRTDHRFLVFKSADDWLAYNTDFGGGADPFKAMLAHVRGMAEDIGAMQILGPNPKAMLTYLENFVDKQAKLARAGQQAFFPEKTEFLGRPVASSGLWAVRPQSYANRMIKRSQDMWSLWRGETGAAVSREFAEASQAVRNINVGTKLGGAVLSSLPDAFTQMSARWFAGLPATRTVGDIVSAFTPADRREAHRAAVISEVYLHALQDGAREAGQFSGPVWSRVFAERVMALSGMNVWNDASRRGMSMALLGGFARMADQGWSDLPPRFRRGMTRYGLSERDWDAIRIDPATGAPRDVDFIVPGQLMDELAAAGRGQERIAERLLGAVLQETDYATAQPLLRARALMLGSNKSGTVPGELLRHLWQFKSFSVTVGFLHFERWGREMVQHGGRGAAFAGAALATMMLGGAMAMQLKELAYAKDPRPMDESAFWLAALLQSGGAGIWGDFLAAEANRFGNGIATTLGGPTAGLLHDAVVGPVVSNLKLARDGKPTQFGHDAARIVQRYTPGASLWYLRTVWSRVFAEQLQEAIDPKAERAFRQTARQQRREVGNDFYWPLGKKQPLRGPRLERAFGRQ